MSTGRPAATGATPAVTGAPPTAAKARRRPRFTGRAAILVLVLAVLTVSYASSLRAYLQQRAHLGDLTTQIAQRQASIDSLEDEKQRWLDPAYQEQRARESGMVMPGERSYVVLGEDGKPIEAQATLTDPSTVARSEPTAWWTEAWDSVQLAGNPPKQVGKPPLSQIDGSQADGGGTTGDTTGDSTGDTTGDSE